MKVRRRGVKEGADHKRVDEWRVEGKREAPRRKHKVEARQSRFLKKDIEKLTLEIELFLLMLSLKREQDMKLAQK